MDDPGFHSQQGKKFFFFIKDIHTDSGANPTFNSTGAACLSPK
jgi:hypothetical protein